jgi:hypothetical protein
MKYFIAFLLAGCASTHNFENETRSLICFGLCSEQYSKSKYGVETIEKDIEKDIEKKKALITKNKSLER